MTRGSSSRIKTPAEITADVLPKVPNLAFDGKSANKPKSRPDSTATEQKRPPNSSSESSQHPGRQ
eukprot:2541921-Pyramimonas_sp.AAC.1